MALAGDLTSEPLEERIIYTALRDEEGAYRGVVESVLPVERVDRPGAA